MTDADFMQQVLADGEWHSRDEIIRRSQQERGFGLTPHSRAPDIRKRGFVVETTQRRTANGRVASFYRLVALEAPVVEVGAGSAAGSPQATGASSVGPFGDGERPAPTLDIQPPLFELSRGAYSQPEGTP